MHERAGDDALRQHIYDVAGQNYRLALDGLSDTTGERNRLMEKLANALLLGASPDAADVWIEQVIQNSAGDPEKSIRWLLRKFRRLQDEAKYQKAMPILSQILQLAEEAGDARLLKFTKVRIALAHETYGYIDLADRMLQGIGEINDSDSAEIRYAYYRCTAERLTQQGKADEAYVYFDRALQAAQEGHDVLAMVNTWATYAFWAIVLGNIARAKACTESGLLIARTEALWFVPNFCVMYASILAKMGNLNEAKTYVAEAVALHGERSVLDTIFAVPLLRQLSRIPKVTRTRVASD